MVCRQLVSHFTGLFWASSTAKTSEIANLCESVHVLLAEDAFIRGISSDIDLVRGEAKFLLSRGREDSGLVVLGNLAITFITCEAVRVQFFLT